MTIEQRERLSVAHKGHTPWNKGLKNWMDEETKRKANEKKKGRPSWNKGKKCPYVSERNRINNPQKKGPLSYTWKGGISWPWLKNLALARDNYTCQLCGYSDSEILQVDHIQPKCKYPELSKEINNLMTLCPNCHARKTIRERKNNLI